jgi:hypothetical protein
MRKLLLAAGAVISFGAPAHAACTIDLIAGNGHFFNCQADNQGNDGDDLKLFVDKNATPIPSVTGSLGGNSNDPSFQNIMISANDTFTTGNGYANLKFTGDTATEITYTPIPNSLLDVKGHPAFNGFDGFIFRGQLIATGTSTTPGITVTLDEIGGGTASFNFGVSNEADFGSLGFDELLGKIEGVKDVHIFADTGFAFEQIKQLDFSVSGQTIPEASTWAMMLLGFASLGFAGHRASRKTPTFTA